MHARASLRSCIGACCACVFVCVISDGSFSLSVSSSSSSRSSSFFRSSFYFHSAAATVPFEQNEIFQMNCHCLAVFLFFAHRPHSTIGRPSRSHTKLRCTRAQQSTCYTYICNLHTACTSRALTIRPRILMPTRMQTKRSEKNERDQNHAQIESSVELKIWRRMSQCLILVTQVHNPHGGAFSVYFTMEICKTNDRDLWNNKASTDSMHTQSHHRSSNGNFAN